jgi:hypothetical protein
MRREKIKSKIPREKRTINVSAAQFNDMEAEFENAALSRALRKIASLEHEIRTIQNSAYEVVKRAGNEAAKQAREEITRKYEFRLKEAEVINTKLAQQVARFGDTIACPDCGACHPLNDYLKAK